MTDTSHLIKIAITGPECTGKSTIASSLAKHYNTVWVEEYSRQYLKSIKTNYSDNDILQIAKGQLSNEEYLYNKANKIIFADTELIVNKIWMMYKFNKTDSWIEKNITNHKYDLYLLCYPDIEWQFDKLREHPNQREELFGLYETELKSIDANYFVVKNKGNQRISNAISIVDNFLKIYNK